MQGHERYEPQFSVTVISLPFQGANFGSSLLLT